MRDSLAFLLVATSLVGLEGFLFGFRYSSLPFVSKKTTSSTVLDMFSLFEPSDYRDDTTVDVEPEREKLSDYPTEDELSEYERGENRSERYHELVPTFMSRNSGNRFVALWWDKRLDKTNRTVHELHDDRILYTLPHVRNSREANLYNQTANNESMVDVLWSRQILASDMARVIGQAVCLEARNIGHVREFMAREPLMTYISHNDTSRIPLYRWRHYRDYSMGWDDGRFGTPCMMVAWDADKEEVGDLRDEINMTQIEYLIRSERVIAAGTLHVATERKDDPASHTLGELIMFNAKDREEAVAFAENSPNAQAGLYKQVVVHFYNNFDITGKFNLWSKCEITQEESYEIHPPEMGFSPTLQMYLDLEAEGYPVGDYETPWLNY